MGARGNAGSAAGAVYLFMSKDGLPADGSTVDKASDSFVTLYRIDEDFFDGL